MNGQTLFYQQARTLSLPDPFLYRDCSYLMQGESTWYFEDMWMDGDLETPTPNQEFDPPSDYVEYGDDCIDAGPTSFPSNEYFPSEQEMLRAQEVVQTVCPSDLLRSSSFENVQVDLDPSSEVSLFEQDTMCDAAFEVSDIMQLDFSYDQPLTMCPGVIPQFPPQQVSATSEEFPYELDDEVDLASDQVADYTASMPLSSQNSPEPSGQVKLVDSYGEEYIAWAFETILDSRKVAKCRGGLEYLVQWAGYSPTWQPARDLRDNLEEITEFHNNMPQKPGPPRWVLRALTE